VKHPEIRLTGCQIKSIAIARKLARHLDEIETIVGIKETRITLVGCFICPDISDEQLDSLNKTPMEKSLRTIIRKLR
jgi:sulfite reductase beta subunit-like hemoprotein